MTGQTVLVRQAVFGEVRGAHGVLASTYQSSNLPTLAMRLDLPDQAPVGVGWEPYLAGFSFEGHYVLASINPDPSASRAGMIHCRAAILANGDLDHIHDLSQIADLVRTPPLEGRLADIELLPNRNPVDPASPLTIGLANVLATRSTIPAVLGQGGEAEMAIFQVWRNLPPTVRANFGFRLSFGVKDLVEAPQPTVVFVPDALKSRWPAERVVGQDISYTSNLAEVLGGAASFDNLAELTARLGVVPKSVADLIRLNLAANQLSGTSFEEVLAGFRLVQTMPTDSGSDQSSRAEIVSRLALLLAAEPVSSVMLLRNVTATGFTSISAIWSAVESRIASLGFDPEDDEATFELFGAAQSTAIAEKTWKESVAAGLSFAASASRRKFFELLWRFGGAAEVFKLVEEIERDHLNASAIIAAAPGRPANAAAKAMEWLGRQRKEAELVAFSLRAQYPLADAIDEYFKYDPKFQSAASLDRLFAGASAVEIIDAVSKKNSEQVVKAAARVMVENPVDFKSVDFTSETVRKIWGAAVAISAKAWKAPDNVAAAIHGLFDTLASGKHVDPVLLDAVSRSPHADLTSYADRALVWNAVPEDLRGRFLKVSAGAWLRSVSEGKWRFDPDQQLRSEIMRAADFSAQLLKALRAAKVDMILRADSVLRDLGEDHLVTMVEELRTSDERFAIEDASDLGKLVALKGWSKAAVALKSGFDRGRRDFKPALEACQGLLPSWVRYSLGLGKPTDGEAWEMLRDVCVNLYPYGPDDRHLWERAGGDNAKLLKGRGEAAWFDAIGQVKKGGAVKASKLLQQIKQDFGGNPQIRYLSELPIFRSKSGGSLFSIFDPLD